MSRPPQTSRAEFVEAAATFIDLHGVDDFNLRSLAKTMNLSHPALYRHFANKEDLVDQVIDHQLGIALKSVALGVAPKERLLAIAHGLRNHFDQHPNLVKPWINGTGQGENAFQVVAVTLRALRELGISPTRLGHWLRILENFLVGGLAYDYAAAPHHLTIRSQRLGVLRREGLLSEPVEPGQVEKQNRSAFEEALGILLERAVHEGQSTTGG